MSALIENMLDLARGRLGGGLPLSRTSALLEPVLMEVIAELKSSQPDRIVETEFSLAEPVNCDPARIAQLFSNLLGNAFAYGVKEKPIRVRQSMTQELRAFRCKRRRTNPSDLA